MTEKELRKLKRSDFLQLLLAQGKDMSAVQTRLDEATKELEQLRASGESLRAKLDEKNELIKELKGHLDTKDATISALRQEIEDMKAIMMAIRLTNPESADPTAILPQNLNEIFESARSTKTGMGHKNRPGRSNRRRSRS